MRNDWIIWTGVALMALGGSLGMAQEEAPVLVPKGEGTRVAPPPAKVPEPAGEPWLGVYVSKASSAVYAQLRGVPKGVGFLVDGVAADGPAELAGLQQYDFLWKLNDQLLVNESQFLTLLALQKAGETIRLTYFRGGENLEVEAVLAGRPAAEQGRVEADLAVVSPPAESLPVRILNVADRMALLRDESGTVSIQRGANGYDWALADPQGNETRKGTIAGSAEDQLPATIREPLRSKLKALVRSFEEVETRQRLRLGRMRVRTVPMPPTER